MNRIRMIVVGVIVPLVIVAAGTMATLVSLPLLPDPIAVHWGMSGAVDRTGPVWLAILIPALVVFGYSGFAFLIIGPAAETGHFTGNQRLLLAIGPFFATIVTGVITGSVLIQRGLTDAMDAPSVLPVVLIAFVAGIVIGVVAWFALPPVSILPEPSSEPIPVIALGPTDRVSWTQHIEPQRALGVPVIIVSALAVTGGAVALWLTASIGAFLFYVIVMLVLLVLVIGTLFWRVTIDGRGFRAISTVGLPRFVIPLAEIESADVTNVQPVGDFGGWGIRWGGKGRVGIILRTGPAIEVRRKDGRSLVVTLNDARTAAGVVNSLVAQAAARSERPF